MKKKNYMKPTLKVVQLKHSQHILAGSYAGIQSKNSSDDDNPDYNGIISDIIWNAN